MIRAATRLLPVGTAYIADDTANGGPIVIFANPAIWPDDPHVIQIDMNRSDPRRDDVLGLFWETVDEATADTTIADVVQHLEARFKHRAKAPVDQVSMFA